MAEIKVVENPARIFETQLLTYLNTAGKKVGLIINFDVPLLKEGIKRMVFQENTEGRKKYII